jgi:hypothetical protein
VTVSKESSKAFVSLVTFDSSGNITSSSASTAAYGSPYIMRIDVTNASSTACSANSDAGTIPPISAIPCPTGSVTVTDNGAALNDFVNSNSSVASNIVTLNSLGYFEDQPVQLPAGNHSLVAAYAGDNSYTASTSAADAVAITLAGTTTTQNGPLNATSTQAVTITVTITTNSSGVAPTGTVSFVDAVRNGVNGLSTVPVVGVAANQSIGAPAAGTATLTVTLPLGQNSIKATYSGDSNYATSTAATATNINVTAGTTGSFTITGTAVSVTAGGSGTSTITVTPSGGFTGNVQVTCAGTGLPPGVICTPNPLTIPVTGAVAATGQLTVAVAAPSTTLSASKIEDSHALYAVANSLPRTNSNIRSVNGWWTLSAGTGVGAMLLLLFPGLRGRKQIRAALGLGLISVLAFTLGCGGGSSGGGGGSGAVATHTSIAVTATKLPSTMNNFAFTVTVTGGVPTGQVQLLDGGAALGLPAAVSNGTVSITTGLGTVGTHSVSAHYLGDTKTLASSSGVLSLTVTGTTTLPLTTTPTGSGNVSLTIQ